MQPLTFRYLRIIAVVVLCFGLNMTSANATTIAAGKFIDGLALIEVNDHVHDEWWSFVDKNGELVGSPFSGVSDFSEGLASVSVKKGKNSKYGYIDKFGKFAIAPKFDYAVGFSEGLAAVKVNGKYGFIDKTGKQVIAPQFAYASSFSEGLASIQKNEKWGFIDKTGKQVISLMFDDAGSFSEDLASFKKSGKQGFINKTGAMVIAPQYKFADDFKEGLARVRMNDDDKMGFIDKTGKQVIAPQFNEASSFCEGMAAVGVNGKYGFIDKTGSMVISPQFEGANSFHEGLAAVKVKDKYGVIDKSGKLVVSPQFEFPIGDFSEGVASILTMEVAQNAKAGFINHQGQGVITPETLSNAVDKYVIAVGQKEITAFRKTLSDGAESNCGPVIEVKDKLVKVSFAVANYGNEHWIRRDQIFPSGYGCRFVNGQYQIPE